MSPPRRARTTDATVLADLEQTCFGTDAWSTTSVRQELAAGPDRRYFVVASAETDSDRPIGYAVLSIAAPTTPEPTAELLRIAVRPDRRREGFGRMLLADVLAEADRRCCAEVLLEVRADNQPAVRLYEAHDFEPIATRRGYYDLGRVDALVFRRPRPG